jgi:hypothetical protein
MLNKKTKCDKILATILLLVISATQASTLADSDSWAPPIGIPAPPFGINETYRMYDNADLRMLSGLTYYASNSGGYYTHYIDAEDANSTDDGNNFGSSAQPRKTIPWNLPAGSIVEIHNQVNQTNAYNYVWVTGQGTSSMPIFVRGVGLPRADAVLRIGQLYVNSYIIVDGISFHSGEIVESENSDTTYCCIRNCEFRPTNPGESGNLSMVSYTAARKITNCVFYNNIVHDFGDWMETEDNDTGSTSVAEGVNYAWIVDNEFYHIDSSGFVVCPKNQNISNDDENCPHHIYVGRNQSHHNRQDGIWSKTSRDVIFSQNICYGNREAGMGFQYDPKRLWFLFNICGGNELGGSANGGQIGNSVREEMYFIGNLIYNSPNGYGICINSLNLTESAKYMFNIIYGCKDGFKNDYYDCKVSLFNNIIATYTHAIHFGGGNLTYQLSDMDYNLLDGSGDIIWGTTYANLSALIAGTSQGDNCIEANPLFVDPENGDFNLQAGSPVNNMATSDKTQAVFDRFLELYGIDLREDIDGVPRTTAPIVVPDTGEASPEAISEASSTQEAQPDVSNIEDTSSSVDIKPTQSTQEDAGKLDTEDNTKKTTKPLRGAGIKMRKIFERFEELYGENNRGRSSREHFE